MKCDKCGYSDNGSGDWAHVCGTVNIMSGADLHAGDGGYSVGTKEKYDEFVKGRNQSLGKMRIQALAEQATEYANKENELHGVGYVITFKEKFAQLIVAECISMADKESERYSNLDQEYCSMAMDNYRELVRKHFGVEE